MNEFKQHIEKEVKAYTVGSFIAFVVFFVFTFALLTTDFTDGINLKIKFYLFIMIFSFGIFIGDCIRVYMLENMKQMIKAMEENNEQK